MGNVRCVVGLVLALIVSGCGWVDSTGRQTNVAPKLAIDSRVLDEREVFELDLSNVDSDGNLVFVAFDVLAVGSSLAGSCAAAFDSMAVFSPTDYADDLNAACSTGGTSCTFSFTETETGSLKYSVTVPELQRPTAYRFKLTLEDSDAASSEEQFDLCLRSISEAPVAQNDSFNMAYGLERTVSGTVYDGDCNVVLLDGVQQNDWDDFDVLEAGLASNGCLDAELVSAPSLHTGTFSLAADGGFTYQPIPTAVAGSTDSFSYRLTDGLNTSEIATVTLNIVEQGVNQAPQATNPSPEMDEDGTLELTIAQLATDADGDDLVLQSVGVSEAPASGSLYFEAGLLRYTPNANYFGSDSFSYFVRDVAGATATGLVSVTVQSLNDRPVVTVVGSDTVSLSAPGESATVYFNVSDVETPLPQLLLDTLVSDSSVASATVSLNASPSTPGDVQVDVTADAPGQTDVVVTANDGDLAGSATLEVNVAAPNTPPTADPAVSAVELGNTLNFDLVTAGAISDADGDTLTLQSAALEVGTLDTTGVVSTSGQTQIDYTPGVVGTHVIEYTVSDGTDSASSTLTVTVTAPNTPPVANTTGTAAVATGSELRFDVVAEGSASDADVGDSLSLQSVSFAAGSSDPTGVLTFSGSEIVYTPGTAGVQEIDFTVTDGSETADGLITVTVSDTQMF